MASGVATSAPQPGDRVRAVLVDDSATVRAVLRRQLESDGTIEVVGTAADGLAALAVIARLRPDVVTLDIEMPRLDGLSTLRRLMAEQPTPVVMVSGLTREGADATIRALELGAVDFIAKSTLGTAFEGAVGELIAKVRAAAGARLRAAGSQSAIHRPPPAVSAAGASRWLQRVVVIGASTGGPQAIRQVVPALPPDLRVPVVVVQHMPAGFTRSLAERLDELGPLRVREANTGMVLTPGEVLLAPGGYHLVFGPQGLVHLDEEPPEQGVRPSINVTMASIARMPRANPVVAVLTGMGSDGTRGCGLIRQAGGYVITEAESTCVVYGMPRAVVEAGWSNESVPLDEVAEAVVRQCRAPVARSA